MVAGLYDTYNDLGLMTISYVSEGALGDPATVTDAQAWANNFEHNGLVVMSDHQDVWYPFANDQGELVMPGILLIEPGLKIAKMGEPTIQEIELVLPGNE